MRETMKYLCENIQGCIFGYTQSDEITFLLQDYKELSAAPQQTYTEVPVVAPSQSSSPEPAEDEPEQHVTTEYTYAPEEEEEYERPSGNTSGLPRADRDAFDEKLSYISRSFTDDRFNGHNHGKRS